MPVTISIADLMDSIKANSSKWINDHGFIKGVFNWQTGYSAFSHSKSQRDAVIHYIMNPEQHHQSKTFKDEYLKMLHDFEVEYEEK